MRVHLCSYCLKPIRQGQPHHMLRDNETPDRPGDWVPFHSKCVGNATGKGRASAPNQPF